MPPKSSRKDLTGMRFGKWTALSYLGYASPGKQTRWLCRCDCGREIAVSTQSLTENRSKQCRSCSRQLKEGEASFNSLLQRYQISARRRDINFDLTKDQFMQITSRNCYYCGISPIQSHHAPSTNGAYLYNGIDRVNNAIGYELNNCVPCCTVCNRAKNTMSTSQFTAWINRVVRHQRKSKPTTKHNNMQLSLFDL